MLFRDVLDDGLDDLLTGRGIDHREGVVDGPLLDTVQGAEGVEDVARLAPLLLMRARTRPRGPT